MAAVSNQLQERWPKRAAVHFSFPTYRRPSASVLLRQTQRFMFSVGYTLGPGGLSQKSMHDPSSIAPSKWPNGTSLSGRIDGPAVARFTSTLAKADWVFRCKKRPPLHRVRAAMASHF